ncbi:MAG: hypothetical protein D8M59_08120 [Planctomycetes bacterium]|nr:hypothetical protein [Planctomycetota bacterium]NOG53290.1 protein kinase [Planctomycetota bacterium]
MTKDHNILNHLIRDLLADEEGTSRDSPLVDLPGYEIGAFIAEGGSSVVFKAVQTSSSQVVAIKFFKRHAMDRAAFERFKREVASMVSLDHRAFPRVIDCGEYDGSRFIVQEFIEGKHLLDYVDEHGLKGMDLVRLVVKIARAVEAAHAAGIIHRDLKPENILVNERGEIVVIDFGIATAAPEVRGFTEPLTQEGAAVGTVGYMSPEQARGESDLTPASDVFSLGVILVRLLTGTFPHDESGSTHERIARIGKEAARIGLLEGVERQAVLRAILNKALELEVTDRYANAAALANDLEAYLGGKRVAVAPTERGGHGFRLARYPMLGFIVLLPVIALAGLSVKSIIDVNLNKSSEAIAAIEFEKRPAEFSGKGVLDESLPLVGNAENKDRFGLSDITPEQWKELNAMQRKQIIVTKLATYGILAMGAVTMAQQPCEIVQLLASDPDDGDRFGEAVALDGNRIIIGACEDDEFGLDAGAAYVFDFDGNEWLQTAKLHAEPPVPGSYFGTSVDILGDRLVVGGIAEHAYVFDYLEGGWEQTQTLRPSDGTVGDLFGHRVALNESYIVVGSYRHSPLHHWQGAVYVFRYNDSEWIEDEKLLTSDADGEEQFGVAVSIARDADVILIGAPYDSVPNWASGSAYIFRHVEGKWTEEKKLLSDPVYTTGYFGSSVSISETGDTAVVGKPWGDEYYIDAGSVHVYHYDGSSWSAETKLFASDISEHDNLGYSVAISGSNILGGAYFYDAVGKTYWFRFDGYEWDEAADFQGHDTRQNGGLLGYSVAADGDIAVVGAPLHDPGVRAGAVYVFDLDCRGRLAISPEPLQAVEPATFTMTGMNPNAQTWIAYSTAGLGASYIPQLHIVLDLAAPKQAFGPRLADSTGFVEWQAVMPYVNQIHNVWFQGCQYELLTNVVETQVVP